jgi:hypothetical protein
VQGVMHAMVSANEINSRIQGLGYVFHLFFLLSIEREKESQLKKGREKERKKVIKKSKNKKAMGNP